MVPVLDWREIDLGGARPSGLVNGTPYGRGVLVTGGDAGAAYVALVTADGRVAQVAAAGEAPVWSAVVPELDVEYTCGSPPRSQPGEAADDLVTGSRDDPPVRAWLTCGDEDPCTLTLSRAGELFAYEYGAETPTGGVWLHDRARADGVTVAGAEIGLLVAGPLSDAPAGHGATAWRYANEQWSNVSLSVSPDDFTDSYTRWEPVLAGHLDGVPVLVSHAGTTLPAPRALLDPTHPMVVVAHVDGPPYGSAEPGWPGRSTLVVQERDGIQLWLQHGAGWTMLPGPPGRLAAARLGHNEKEHAWCIAGDRLWHADLGAVWAVLD